MYIVQVLQLHAVDCDEGSNAEVKYSVDKPSYFAVNSSTGMVTVWNRLDSSSTTEHVLRVSGDGVHIGGMFHHGGYVSLWLCEMEYYISGICFIMAV